MTSVRPRTSSVLAFLVGDAPDAAGRSLKSVLALDDATLENRHDFIQWLFPLNEPSLAVPGSPVLAAEDVVAIAGSPRALANLMAAADRMGRFYCATDAWMAPHDHNHLRISRIIRSLRLLVGDTAADHFRAAILEQVRQRGGRVSVTSLEHWSTA